MHYVQIGKLDSHRALIANNGDYDIKLLDLKEMRLTPFLKKKYKKVKIKETWNRILKPVSFPHEDVSGKKYKKFVRESLDDVQRIGINGNKIWILTSTFNEATRLVKVDVYDFKGNPKGTFDLQMPGGFYLFKMSYTSMTFHSEKLYIVETSEEGDKELVCYKLLGVPAWAR